MKTKAHSSQASQTAARTVQSLAEALAAIKDSQSGCRLAAYGDLSAQLVLRSAPAGARPQEDLDAFCRQAREGFSLGDALAQLTPTALNEGEIAPDHALACDTMSGADCAPDLSQQSVLALVPGEVRVFLRDGETPSDALFLACDGVEAAREMVGQADNLLSELQSQMDAGPGEARS